MPWRSLSALSLALGALLSGAAAPAIAKDFRPGDVRLCDAKKCVAIMDQTVLDDLARFYYGGPAPAEVRAPWLGALYFQLKYSNGDVTGIAATARLDRFRSGGVNMGQFGMDSWYRVPARLAQGLRKLGAGLRPLRVTSTTIGRTATADRPSGTRRECHLAPHVADPNEPLSREERASP